MVKALFKDTLKKLSSVTDSAEFEAGVIFEEVFGRDWRLKLISGMLDRESDDERLRVEGMVERRLKGEPLQYIVGEWEFYGLSFKVAEGVLIPRQDTEALVDTALRLLGGISSPRVLDLCSGTGCVAAAIKSRRPDSDVSAMELSREAYEILAENSKRYGVKAVLGDALSENSAADFSGLDLITANPPYLTENDMKNLQREVGYEPEMALYGGEDGLEFYRRIPAVWRNSLKPGGFIAFEVGKGQEIAVAELLASCGYKYVETADDLAGITRVVDAVRD